MPKPAPTTTRAVIERNIELAACFSSAKLMTNDSQVTRSTFASDEVLLPDGRRLEIMLDVEPWVSKVHGLSWRMWLEPYLCEEDSCQQIFEFVVPREIVASVASSPKPIEKLFTLRPALLERALRSVPGLSQALEARVAQNQRVTLRKTAPPAPPAPRRPSL